MFNSLLVLRFKVEVRYNLPSSRDEICKFDVKTKVQEVKEDNAGNLFGPVQDEGDENEGQDKDEKKGGKKGKGCKKLKTKEERRRCRKKGQDKDKKPPPKHQPVKSIHLKVCTR